MIFLISMLKKHLRKERATFYKIISLIIGGLISLVILPGLLFLAGRWIGSLITFPWSSWVRFGMVVVFIPMGLFFIIWSILAQWRMAGEVSSSEASSEVLIITGPYSYCRNPYLLGIMFYYLGLGTVLVSVTVGLFSFFLGWLIGTLYFKLAEEKEWENRFGEEYIKYRERTAYLFPKSVNWV